ncbi:hypothetical protein [Paenimyroides aestuarii]|uniref:Uncharacterized protein n=1 Tax=Paenimyroides aestuarii TaxID=2968490 RepID=A0ABY5NP51_9FLAO|nr:hypothetical protein [Paenimyroides aestuarii]UUV20282.1 hypothetical protein NPX36_07850 [Paenimyroides aestuarii]
MKKIVVLILSGLAFTACVGDDSCGCVTPPEPDEILAVHLKNSGGSNLLNPAADGHIPNEQFTFYLITKNQTINLTDEQSNNSIIQDFVADALFDNGYLRMDYSWYMPDENGFKEGNYVIDYNGLYPNDTIFAKYKTTDRSEVDPLVQLKINGVQQELQQPNSELMHAITIIK